MIKSSKHHILKVINSNKMEIINNAINEYRRVAKLVLDDIWENGYQTTYVNKHGAVHTEFNINQDKYDLPQFLDHKKFAHIEHNLAGRGFSSLLTQLCGCITAVTELQRRRVWRLNDLLANNKTKGIDRLKKAIADNKPTKPDLSKMNMEISSKCMTFTKANDDRVLGYINFHAVLKGQKPIIFPIMNHKHARKLSSKGEIMTSFLVSDSIINIRWKIETPPKVKSGIKVGADTGIIDPITLSNMGHTGIIDPHGHTLKSLMEKLSRKKKGSKRFARTKRHMKQYIDWFVNQLDLSNVKQINLEKVINIRFGKKSSRFMSHWSNPCIRDALLRKCEDIGVHVSQISSAYRSQRCSDCGFVHKKNRKGKQFKCVSCSHTMDADINASFNLLVDDLPELPVNLEDFGVDNKIGFYWTSDGVISCQKMELEFPLTQNDNQMSYLGI